MASLISLQSITKSFGNRPLFEAISLVISENERIALIGPNGSGKSTLFKILAGVEHQDAGEISTPKGLRLAYVPQVDALPEHRSVEEVLKGSLLEHQHDEQALISIYAGKAGFTDKEQKVASLSGGWRKRLSITCALIKEPQILLLDEPTNHLDIDSILWLEELLLTAPFAVAFISHDRYFIERVASRVIELDRRYPKGFLSSSGHYSDFLETREAYLEQLQSYKESLANKVRREVEWLRRGAKARTTKARGRIKQAGALINELQSIDLSERSAGFEFSSSNRKTKELVKTESISKTLGGRILFESLTITLSPGTRLGVAGSNGTGKTTLLKTLTGSLEPDRGRVWRAPNLRVAYFDQNRRALNPEDTLTKALCREGDAVQFNGRELHVSAWARRFLFRDEQLKLPVKFLSGGEQARVMVARMMLEPADILVLDEPTNDLDISTLEVLEETLCEFSGAVVLVTHDRYMLDRVCSKVIGLSGVGHCAIYADYTQWEIERDEIEQDREACSKKTAREGANNESREKSSKAAKLTYAERLELERMEETILGAEDRIQSLQSELSKPEISSNPEKLQEKCAALARNQKQVEDLYNRWHELERKQAEYEAAKAKT